MRTRVHAARAQEDLLHSEPLAGVRLEATMCLLHLECLKFATHTTAHQKAAFVDLEE